MRRLVPVSLLAALALVACGDSGMSTSEYRAEAKKICVDAEQATDDVKQPTRSTTDAIAEYLRRLLKANERTTRRFEKLDAPKRLQAAHDELLKANDEGATTVRHVIDELDSGKDPRQVLEASTSRLRELGQRSNAAAKKLGVPECEQ
jgi:hypothetical protein